MAGQSLLSHKKGINITNRNISNVFTEGYVRKVPVFQDMPTGGVNLEKVERQYNESLFKRFVSVNQEVFGDEKYKDVLEQIESVFNDIQGSGFSSEINEFFNSFNDMAVNPDDLAARQKVLTKAQDLIGRIRNSNETLNDIKEKTSLSVQDNITKLNNLTEHLTKINQNIRAFQKEPEKLNFYLDERDKTLKEISNLIDTKVIIGQDGTVDVTTSKGFTLVDFDKSYNLSYEADADKNPIIRWDGIDITSELVNGEIGGDLRGIEFLNKNLKKLDDFTTTLALTVNKIHRDGYDLNGNNNIDFFTIDPSSSSTKIDSSNIYLNISDPKNIAAASDPTYTNADNTNIKKIINLKDSINGALTPSQETDLSSDNEITIGSITYKLNDISTYNGIKEKSFNEFYSSGIVAPIGFEIEHVKDKVQQNTFLRENIDEKMKEISSVNMDEELINLTKLQRAYEASAKIINVTDELLQTVLGLVK
jgi:flagellar hook-associated protein 1 FlgK